MTGWGAMQTMEATLPHTAEWELEETVRDGQPEPDGPEPMPNPDEPGPAQPPVREPAPTLPPEGDPEPGEAPVRDPEPPDSSPDDPDPAIQDPMPSPDGMPVDVNVTEAHAEEAAQVLAELGATASPDLRDAQRRAMLEAIVYITDEPLSPQQIAQALGETLEEVERLLEGLVQEYAGPEHGLTIREVAGGYKMATKPEHHEAIRTFVKNLKPPLKLSMAALETLAVIAYKQPITAPEIQDIRGVQGGGVLKTLVDRKLITTAGRKAVVGKPILYKTTREFLLQFGLRDLSELPTLKEFEELRRLALSDGE